VRQLIPAVPIPLSGANLRVLAYFLKWGKFSRVGTKKEGKCPSPEIDNLSRSPAVALTWGRALLELTDGMVWIE